MPIKPSTCHPELHEKLLIYNFTFDKQDMFYYQWYADYLYEMTIKQRIEYVNYYKFKHIHETLESRNVEGKMKRENTLNQWHWDFNELQK